MSSLLGGGGISGTLPGSQGGSLVLVEQHTGSASAALNFTTGITATYDTYVLDVIQITGSTGGRNLQMAFSSNAGSSWIGSSYNTLFADQSTSNSAWAGAGRASTAVGILTLGGVDINGTGNGFSCQGVLQNLQNTGGFKTTTFRYGFYSGNAFINGVVGVGWSSTTAINAIQLALDSGTLTGTVRLYGIAKS